MADDKEPTKRDLLEALTEALEKSNALLVEQGATLARTNLLVAEQAKAIEELRAREAPPLPSQIIPQPGPQKIPYAGLVRSKEACWIGHLRSAGEIFHHEVPCLWSDDPFEPVMQTGSDSDGNPTVVPHTDAPTPLPFHLRPRTVDVLAARAATPQRASEW